MAAIDNPNADILVPLLTSGRINCCSFYRGDKPFPEKVNALILGSSKGELCYLEINMKVELVKNLTHSIPGGNVLEICWDESGEKVYVVYKAGNETTRRFLMWNLDTNRIENDVEISNFNIIHSSGIRWVLTEGDHIYDLFKHEDVCVCTDVNFPRLIACTDTKVYGMKYGDLENVPLVVDESTICTAKIFQAKDENYVALGFANGKISIHPFDDLNKELNKFAISRTRSPGIVQIAVHPVHKTLVVVREDNIFTGVEFPHIKPKMLKMFDSKPISKPITCCDFNKTGEVFAYAVGDGQTLSYVLVGNYDKKLTPHSN